VEELLKQRQWLAIVRDGLSRVTVRRISSHRCVSLRAAQRRHHPLIPRGRSIRSTFMLATQNGQTKRVARQCAAYYCIMSYGTSLCIMVYDGD